LSEPFKVETRSVNTPNIYRIREFELYDSIRKLYAEEFNEGIQFRRDRQAPLLTSNSVYNFEDYLKTRDWTREDLILIFDPLDFVRAYSSMRIFRPELQDNRIFNLKAEVVLRDFRLINDLLLLKSKGLLKEGAFERVNRRLFEFSTWDQEYNYVYGYMGRIKKWVKGTPLEAIDLQSYYRINIALLRQSLAAIQSRGDQPVLTEFPTPPPPVFDFFAKPLDFLEATHAGREGYLHLECAIVRECGIVGAPEGELSPGVDYEFEIETRILEGRICLTVNEKSETGVLVPTQFKLFSDPEWKTHRWVFTPLKGKTYTYRFGNCFFEKLKVDIRRIQIRRYFP
jgi:hypothetical protein